MTTFYKHMPDVIALIIVVGCLVLIFKGIDGEIKGILGMATGFIFGRYAPIVASKITDKRSTKD